MTRILLINPNTSAATTASMVAIARDVAPDDEIVGVTARRGPAMILTGAELAGAEPEVLDSARAAHGAFDGIIVGAFGDPGVAALRRHAAVPVVGIAEASMLEAAAGRRRFGVATTTPALVELIAARAAELGLAEFYTGIRLTPGDPMTLVADPARLEHALAEAARQSIEEDGAEAVVIGGGPLGQAAIALATRFPTPIIAPIPAAMRRMMAMLAPAGSPQEHASS